MKYTVINARQRRVSRLYAWFAQRAAAVGYKLDAMRADLRDYEAALYRLNKALAASAASELTSGPVIYLPARMPAGLLNAGPIAVEWPVPERETSQAPMVLNRAWLDAWRVVNGHSSDEEMLHAVVRYGTPRALVEDVTALPTRVYRANSRLDPRPDQMDFVKWTDESLVFVDTLTGETVRYMRETVQRQMAVGTLLIKGPRPDWARPVEVKRDEARARIMQSGYRRTGTQAMDQAQADALIKQIAQQMAVGKAAA